MAMTTEPKLIEAALDFLKVVQLSGVLTSRQIEDIRAKIQSGAYPLDAPSLARRLVRKGVLTELQVRHLMNGKTDGLIVDRYVILDMIGKGAMGRVFKARHRLMGRVVALKFISREFVARPGALSRFLREMRLVGRLDHPNIVRAYDAHQIGVLPYIVMEYVPGENLGRILSREGVRSESEVIRYAQQTALGLAHAHAQGIIHRDIKPSNLLLGKDGRIRVLDLGLSSLTQREAEDQESFATADGIAVGTVEFMSPEQASGRELDGRSDLFSLGCAMYHLLTGEIPFPGDSKVECLARRITGRPEPITNHRPDLSPGVVAIIDRLMATRPEDRFASAGEAADALLALELDLAPPASPAPKPLEEPSSPAVSTSAGSTVATDVTSSVVSTEASTGSPLPRWFQFLLFLAERTPLHGLVVAVGAMVASFFAGFVFALLLLR